MVVAILLMLVGIFLLARAASNSLIKKGKGALQVIPSVKASVLLDNKTLGEAPLRKDDLTEGEYELKIIPQDTSLPPFTSKIKINPNVLTVVERTFLPGALASSYILTLEKTNSQDPEFFIASIPEGALVAIDGEDKGVTPLSDKQLSASEHEVEIQKQGFAKKTIRIRTVPSYKLVLNVVLGTDSGISDTQPTQSPSTTPSPSVSPTPSGPTVTILDTPTGFLRVRSQPSTGSNELGRVNPGENYALVDEQGSWYQIIMSDGTKGWISSQYASKN